MMHNNEILKADVLDILFHNRNKLYGAYTLRKHYNKRLGLALGIALGIVLLIILLFRPGHVSGEQGFRMERIVQIASVPHAPVIEKPELPKPRPARAAAPAAQEKFTTPIIKEDDRVETMMADQEALDNSMISHTNMDGPDATGPGLVPPGPPAGGNEAGTEIKEPESGLLSSEPEFPGGQKAWLDFLNKHLIVPDELEAGEKKTVLIRFQVAVDGSVTGFEVVQSGGTQFDKEVIRVLKKMPRWKPAIQKGHPVVRYFTQPVIFVGLE